MTPAHTATLTPAGSEPGGSLDASDEFDLPLQAATMRYCPTELLGTFTLLMSGHGRCVSAAMMLGDREYAMWQLVRAQTLGDETLSRVALRLFAYFDERRQPA